MLAPAGAGAAVGWDEVRPASRLFSGASAFFSCMRSLILPAVRRHETFMFGYLAFTFLRA